MDNHPENHVSHKASAKKRYVRILAWILSILMAGSCATLIITMILYFAQF